MKVVAFNGSPRQDGNTATLLGVVLMELHSQGIETELVHLKGPLSGCIACFQCFEKKDGRCAQKKDMINECIEKMSWSGWDHPRLAHLLCRPDARAEGPHRPGRVCGQSQRGYVQAQGGRGCGGCAPGRGHSRLRLHQPLLPHQPDDNPRLQLLEYRHGAAGEGCGKGWRGDRDYEDAGAEYGMALEEDQRAMRISCPWTMRCWLQQTLCCNWF